MNISDLFRLLRKHLVLLLLTPILLAGLVFYFTKNPSFTYSSETTLYTGIASGTSVEMGKSLSYFATNTDFDNLINVINSRATQQEVAIRLLAQHLMLPKYDPQYISSSSFQYVNQITPGYIKALIVKSAPQTIETTYKTIPDTINTSSTTKTTTEHKYLEHTVIGDESLYAISRQYNISVDQIKEINGLKNNFIKPGQILRIVYSSANNPNADVINDTSVAVVQNDTAATFSFSKLNTSAKDLRTGPSSIDPVAFELTVKKLTDLANSGDTNFVYNLLNYNGPHYSLSKISDIGVQRISSSDLVRLKFTSDDPGICQQTLVFFTEVCIRNYRKIKENSSDAVVKYFEFQVNQATQKLKIGEAKLLAFNKDNRIINFYEQSKAVAGAKEALDVDYNNMRIKLAGIEATIKRIEEKLEKQQQIQLQSGPIIDKRNKLSQINTKIATAETIGYDNTTDGKNLAALKVQAEELKEDIRKLVSQFYSFNNSVEGVPTSALLNDWITNILSYEDTKAGLEVLTKRIADFQKQYDIYAPAGANLKKIEREISVSEQEFLELLHGLNLAKLKMQDVELSSNIKSIDQPYYPLTPNPTKRKFLIIGAALFGFIIVLTTILALEFFDETLINPKKTAKILNLLPLGIFPKIYLKPQTLNFPFITQRLIEIIVQHIELMKNACHEPDNTYQILIYSTSNKEGKSVIAQNMASQLKKLGNKVIVLKYSQENTLFQDSVPNYCPGAMITTEKHNSKPKKFSLINWLLGYPDNRIDYQSQFLCKDKSILSDDEYFKFEINQNYQRTNNYKELLIKNNHAISFIPDYVLIEIPPILYYPLPAKLVASIDLPLMVCRANRVWTQADQNASESIAKITARAPLFVLNGTELEVIESVLGVLPKKS